MARLNPFSKEARRKRQAKKTLKACETLLHSLNSYQKDEETVVEYNDISNVMELHGKLKKVVRV